MGSRLELEQRRGGSVWAGAGQALACVHGASDRGAGELAFACMGHSCVVNRVFAKIEGARRKSRYIEILREVNHVYDLL